MVLKTSIFIFLNLFLTKLCHGDDVTAAYKEGWGFRYLEIVKGDTNDHMLPLILAMHYSSSTPEEAASYFENLDASVRVIILQGSYRKRNGYSYYHPDHYTKDSTAQAVAVSQTVDRVAAFLQGLHSIYPVKPVVTGISQGGDISLLLATSHSSLITAAVPLLGFAHRAEYLKFKRSPLLLPVIHLFHGEDDNIVSREYVLEEVRYLTQYFNVKLRIFSGVGHDVNAEMQDSYLRLIDELLKRQLDRQRPRISIDNDRGKR